jgi:hypothetical protein
MCGIDVFTEVRVDVLAMVPLMVVIQVLHLYSGRSLLLLPLSPEVYYSDSNQDGLWEEIRLDVRHAEDSILPESVITPSKPRNSRKCSVELLVCIVSFVFMP